MEPKSTKEGKNSVPGLKETAIHDGDFFAPFKFEFPEFESIPELHAPQFADIFRGMKSMDELMAKAQRESERLFAESYAMFDNIGKDFEKMCSEMEIKEYTDAEGYQVIEGRMKDGTVYIQKTKRYGNTEITKFEVRKDGVIFYKSNSDEDKVTYRGRNGKLIEVSKVSKVSRKTTSQGGEVCLSKEYRGTIKTSHATVIKRRKKKSTNTWVWLLVIAIAAAVCYYVFLR